MASFKAELEVDGVTHRLNRLYFYCNRKRDIRGRPSSKSSWIVIAVIDIQEDSTITGWMVGKTAQKEAKVTYYDLDDDEDKVLKTWTMKAAGCYSMMEKFISDAGFMTTTLLITGEEITNGNAPLKYDAQ